MGERAQKVVVRDGSVSLYLTRWGGQESSDVLVHGEPGLQADLERSEPIERMWDPDFAEGGYLVHFDRRCILIYSWDKAFLHRVQGLIAGAWPDWSVSIVADGVPDFRSYLSSHGLPNGEPAA